ncbi:M20/M25/M40 family metallo-hydrolase [Solimicrobium silvestre]|uniref:Carboxypeptidase Q n=1 Tax=Solimicrobium silvestre TaxID=2099400 RepID=A0A2S9GXC7_9BURK|nr:M20/M25/M40 family metallo-hydrolase [Solimicrobium silvestre]PRC92375.1 Peptidase family M28 [Solimicrobium silvestre]
MKMIKQKTLVKLIVVVACSFSAVIVNVAHADTVAVTKANGVDFATLARIRDAAMSSDYSYDRLAELTDQIGPRLSGSLGAEAAVALIADDMRRIGMQVNLQPVKVPHWVRGAETAELVEYPNRPAGISQKVVLTALGGSSATPASGLTLPILVVHSMEELHAHAADVKGRIVLFDVAYDQNLANNGHAGNAYGEAGMYRFIGPATASKLGAAAALVRSVGGADFRIPHTGMTGWGKDATPIPAAAVTAEDAMLMTRLAAKGEIKMHLTLTPQTLPDADSHNVIADLPGSDKSDEVVIVSGHMDSWDLATGATDDGAGLVVAMGVADVFKRLGLHPRRTVRMIGWMNEENGTRGGKAYFNANKDKLNKHFAVIESDSGAGRPMGLIFSTVAEDQKLIEPLKSIFRTIGTPILERREYAGGEDVSQLTDSGVPSFEPMLDTRNYFSYHHTPADTLDKVEPENLRRQVAMLAMLTWYLAEMPEQLQQLAPSKPD